MMATTASAIAAATATATAGGGASVVTDAIDRDTRTARAIAAAVGRSGTVADCALMTGASTVLLPLFLLFFFFVVVIVVFRVKYTQRDFPQLVWLWVIATITIDMIPITLIVANASDGSL